MISMRRKAFTLVEFLVTIAILVTLAALVYVLLAPVREKGNETHCISNLRQIGQAIAMYRAEYEGGGRGGGATPMNALQRLGVPHLPTALIDAGYFKWSERSIFTCPSDWTQVPNDPGLNVSYYWPAADNDKGCPGSGVKEGASYIRLREKGDAVAIAIDPWHWDPNYNRDLLDSRYVTKEKKKIWVVLRLGGWVERVYAYLPEGSSSDL